MHTHTHIHSYPHPHTYIHTLHTANLLLSLHSTSATLVIVIIPLTGVVEDKFLRGICHGPPFPKADPQLEAWCHSKTTGNDKSIDSEFVAFMHFFEHHNSDVDNKKEYIEAYDQYRHKRLVNCTHEYPYEILNFTAYKSHIASYSCQTPEGMPLNLTY
jgi:hypothetical protein